MPRLSDRGESGAASCFDRRRLVAAASSVVATMGLSDPSTANGIPSNMMMACGRWIALEIEIENLWDEWADLEVKLAREHADFFKLSEIDQRRLPGGGSRMLEIEQTAAKLTPLRDALLRRMLRLKAQTAEAVVAKLTVASRLMMHDSEPEAFQLVRDSTRDLSRLLRAKA